jgi:hypothetical protein
VTCPGQKPGLEDDQHPGGKGPRNGPDEFAPGPPGQLEEPSLRSPFSLSSVCSHNAPWLSIYTPHGLLSTAPRKGIDIHFHLAILKSEK